TLFEDRLERDLLGPWDGPVEELPRGVIPAERYVLGRLVPRDEPTTPPPGSDVVDGQPAAPIEDDPALTDARAAEVDDGGVGDAAVAVATGGGGSRAAAAIGLPFHVPAEVDVVAVRASGGRYEPVLSETQETETGRPALVWKRFPAGGDVEVQL